MSLWLYTRVNVKVNVKVNLVLRDAELDFQAKLANGRASASQIAIARRAWEIMNIQLQSSPDSVLVYERLPATAGPVQRSETVATRYACSRTQRTFPHLANDAASDAYVRKRMEYLDLGLQIVQSPDMRYRSVVDRQRGRSYLYRENPLVPRIMNVIAAELVRWFDVHLANVSHRYVTS